MSKKKKTEKHPAGGFYWGPDWPKGTPKKYNPKLDQPPKQEYIVKKTSLRKTNSVNV